MSRKLALILTTVLTVFVLVTAVALALRLRGADVSVADDMPTAPTAASTPTDREAQYRQRLEEANTRLLELQAQVEQLQAQNAQLLERDRQFQQRIEEANRLLQQLQTPASTAMGGWPSGPAGLLEAGQWWGRDESEGEEHERHEWEESKHSGRGEHDDD